MKSFKKQIGCWLHERWRLEAALRFPRWARSARLEWLDQCNRHERIVLGDRNARVCPWEDSSWLTVARVFPAAGARLLRHCLALWPPVFGDGCVCMYDPHSTPDISVVIPVSGEDRMPQCVAALASLAGQTGVRFEVVVSEEGNHSVFPSELRTGVRHVFMERAAGEPYGKSRMFNAGVAVARGRYLLLHDADIILPAACLREVVQCLDAGYEGARPLRFLFCLNEVASRRVQTERNLKDIPEVADIMQNFPGGSVALRRDAFDRIGGMDEQFTGWGGEDLEFLDRLRTRRLFNGAWLPGVHLWHAAAAQKESDHRNRERVDAVRALPVEQQIERLTARPSGRR